MTRRENKMERKLAKLAKKAEKLAKKRAKQGDLKLGVQVAPLLPRNLN